MVQKPVVRNWHREQYAEGKGPRDGIPPEALAILDAEHNVQAASVEKPTKAQANTPRINKVEAE